MKTKKKERIEVRLDPGLELLSVLDRLDASRKPAFVLPDHPYARALDKAFSGFAAHPAVALNAKLAEVDRDGSQRKDALMKRSAPPELAFDETMSANRGESERSGALEPWLEGLRAFARDTRFAERLAGCAPLLDKELAELRAAVAASDYLGKLDAYTGLPYEGTFRIFASPLCQHGGVLNRIWSYDDGRGAISCVLPPDLERGFTFVTAELDACVWHEAAHGTMDPVMNLYDYEERDVPLDLGPKLRDACRSWLHGMREHVVRAVMLRLIAADKGAKAAAKRRKDEEYDASPYFGKFLAALETYEASRAEHPTLADFYPRLAELFPKPGARPKTGGESGFPYGPFYTPGQRAAAVRTLDRLLSRSRDARLIERRAAIAAVKG